MGIFDFERLFDLNHDGTLDPLEKGRLKKVLSSP